jgi:hypothetical protein
MRFLLAVVFIAVGCAPSIGAPRSDLQTNDLAVYRAVLDSMFVSSADSRLTQLVLRDSTGAVRQENLFEHLVREFAQLPGADTAAVRSLAMRSRERHSLKELTRLALRVPITFADQQILNSFPREDPEKFWAQFYEKYPGSSGVIELSAIGYSPAQDLAIVRVDQGCGMLCGNGYIVAIRRVGGVWRIAAVQQTWVS